ncbi:hypothetical protein EDB85DRAFT_244854 [Lactarius pseudohatsudake]|nr:hypothetical protein EDB85DRAFT_244854 [Lactarius pseudohatsudake]
MHKTPTFLATFSRSGFGVFGLGPTSHGWVAISVISSRLRSLLAIDLDNSPSLSSPSPSLAPASRHHGLPSTPTPSQDAPQPPIDRPRVPAPRVIFVPQHPVASLISHFPFKMSSMSSSLSAAFGHPQDAIGVRAPPLDSEEESYCRGASSCLGPPLIVILVRSLPFTVNPLRCLVSAPISH